LIQKALKDKNKNFASESEFELFRKLLIQELYGNNNNEWFRNFGFAPDRSRIGTTLGTTMIRSSTFNMKNEDAPYLQKIKAMDEENTDLKYQIFIQSLSYQDLDPRPLSAEYDRKRHNASNYIHPVLVALFVPKFPIIEVHMLYSSIAKIVMLRYNDEPIVDEANVYLFQDITVDPNDVVCDIDSPIADLALRADVQVNLWKTVLRLREGKFYNESPADGDLIKSLNKCRNNLFDNVDIAFNQDDGAIIRRLFNVFSFRPTVISTTPQIILPQMTQYAATNPNFASMVPPVATITTVPMIRLFLPPKQLEKNYDRFDIRDAINQPIWLNEKGQYAPKEQKVIFSRDILIFHVSRRIQNAVARSFASPLQFAQLPLTVSGFDRVNTFPVSINPIIKLEQSDDTYHLRSVVAILESKYKRSNEESIDVVVGSCALFMRHRNLYTGSLENEYYIYDPYGASLPIKTRGSEGEQFIVNKPISKIAPFTISPPGMSETLGFMERAQKYGTIFIYYKQSEKIIDYMPGSI
jgi:hypothetical protein